MPPTPELPSSEVKPPSASASDVFDQLNVDEPVKEPKKEEPKVKDESKVDKDDEVIEDEDDKIKLEEDKEDEDPEDEEEVKDEDVKLADDDAHKGFKALKEAYPDIDKKFPFVRNLIHRDRRYTELFGSLDDAEQVAEQVKELPELTEKVEVFQEFEKSLLDGNIAFTLKNLKETDGKAYDKVIDTMVGQLATFDKEAYFEVCGRIINKLVGDMYTAGKDQDQEDLQQAAVLINQFMGWGKNYKATANRVNTTEKPDEVSDERKKLELEKAELVQTKLNDASGEIQSKVGNVFKATVEKHIDPKDSMTEFVKKHAVSAVIDDVYKQLESDKTFNKTKDNLYRLAQKENFSTESKDRIRRFFNTEITKKLPGALRKARTEALKDMPRKIKTDEEEETPRRQVSGGGRPAQQRSSGKGTERKSGESVSDFMMRD